MPVYTKVNGAWRVWNTTPTQNAGFVKFGGAWHALSQATSGGFWVKVGGTWRVVNTD